MEQEVAAAVAQETAQRAFSHAKRNPTAQGESSGSEKNSAAESQVQSAEERAVEGVGQLLSDVRGFMKIARDGIKQRQTALQYARSTWQVLCSPC